MLDQLKTAVYKANLELVRHGLVTLTWGNVSGISDDRQHVVIKPSGVDYGRMEPEQMVVVDRQGNVIDGDLRPSSDLPTHLLLYEAFDTIGAVTHTHSTSATILSQARVELPCFGTTHADHFHGPVPVTRPLTRAEVETDYESNIGRTIVERFAELDPVAVPAVLTAGHGPFTWGRDSIEAVNNAVALEAVAEMALGVMAVRRDPPPLEAYVLDKHYRRKHGKDAYYGQK